MLCHISSTLNQYWVNAISSITCFILRTDIIIYYSTETVNPHFCLMLSCTCIIIWQKGVWDMSDDSSTSIYFNQSLCRFNVGSMLGQHHLIAEPWANTWACNNNIHRKGVCSFPILGGGGCSRGKIKKWGFQWLNMKFWHWANSVNIGSKMKPWPEQPNWFARCSKQMINLCYGQDVFRFGSKAIEQ